MPYTLVALQGVGEARQTTSWLAVACGRLPDGKTRELAFRVPGPAPAKKVEWTLDVHQKTVVADPTRSLLERADCILGAFDANHRTLSLPGLIARSGLPKTTVYRSLRKMTEMGWVDYYDGRYSIGGRIFEFASVALVSGVTLRESALPALYSAIRQTVASQDDGNGLGRLPCVANHECRFATHLAGDASTVTAIRERQGQVRPDLRSISWATSS